MAEELQGQLDTLYPELDVTLIPTEYAGHAEKLTYDIAVRDKQPLIISVSGDGGYNEVINGAAQAYAKGRSPITSLLPAGNANDHYASVRRGDLLEAIQNEHISTIDLLLLAAGNEKRRAHSYIGFGMTPRIGQELTKTKLNRVTEKLVVFKGLLKPRSTPLIVDGQRRNYDSLTISNIERMAKVLTLSKVSKVDDGLFEISSVEHRNRFSLLGFMVKAATRGINANEQVAAFELKTVGSTLVQLDGEVATIPAHTTVRLSIDDNQLRCIR